MKDWINANKIMPNKEGVYPVILDPKDLKGGIDSIELAYFNGEIWGHNTRGISVKVDYWYDLPQFNRNKI